MPINGNEKFTFSFVLEIKVIYENAYYYSFDSFWSLILFDPPNCLLLFCKFYYLSIKSILYINY